MTARTQGIASVISAVCGMLIVGAVGAALTTWTSNQANASEIDRLKVEVAQLVASDRNTYGEVRALRVKIDSIEKSVDAILVKVNQWE